MAIALVSAGTVASGNPAAPAFGQATTAGNLLIAWVSVGVSGAAFPTCSSGTWTKLAQSGSGGSIAQVWYKKNCGAGETAPTFSNAATVSAAFAEFSGADTAAPADQNGGTNSAASPIVAVAGAVDAAAGELLVSAGSWFLSKAATQITSDTYNNGATPTTNLNNDATSIAGHYRYAWGLTTGNAAADQTSQSSDTMNLTAGSVVVASFKVAAASLAPPVRVSLDAVRHAANW